MPSVTSEAGQWHALCTDEEELMNPSGFQNRLWPTDNPADRHIRIFILPRHVVRLLKKNMTVEERLATTAILAFSSTFAFPYNSYSCKRRFGIEQA